MSATTARPQATLASSSAGSSQLASGEIRCTMPLYRCPAISRPVVGLMIASVALS